MRRPAPHAPRVWRREQVLSRAALSIVALSSLALLSTGLAGCNGDDATNDWVVSLSPAAPPAVEWTASDVARHLDGMGASARMERTTEVAACEPGVRKVQLLGDGLGDDHVARTDWSSGFISPHPEEAPLDSAWMAQASRIEVEPCDGGAVVTLSGAGLLGRQYAAYEWLHELGVRFFHPEETFVPDTLPSEFEPQDVVRVPAFRDRSVSLHLLHPLELGDAFRERDERFADEARRYIDWQIQNGASHGLSGADLPGLERYGLERGFPRMAGVNLRGTQQGAVGTLGADVSEAAIRGAIDEAMHPKDGSEPTFLGFDVRPSEFVFIDEEQAVRELTFAADYMWRKYPGATLRTTAHGTWNQPSRRFGVPFSLLPQYTPSNLGVRVHPLMFYGLTGSAPVYGNVDYGYFLDFMEREAAQRELWYFPEAAWWLTFDIAIPLYLPVTIAQRHRDVRSIQHLLDGKLRGHEVFGSGHEWGFWQNEYCSLRMSTNLDYGFEECLRDIAAPMGRAAPALRRAIEQVVAWQERDLYDAEILRYLVGTDPETELAQAAGIYFHPLPPSPEEMMRWSDTELDAFFTRVSPRLRQIDEDYGALAASLSDERDRVPRAARNFFDEVSDGIAAFGLRARHQERVYGAVAALRAVELSRTGASREAAERLLGEAEAATEAVLDVIRRREQGYRYRPLSRSVAGGPDGSQDTNWTTYPYRYLNRTHTAYYFEQIDERVRGLFLGRDALSLSDRVLAPGETLNVLTSQVKALEVNYGDGGGSVANSTHRYAAPGLYEVIAEGRHDGERVRLAETVVSLARECHGGFSGALVEPVGAEIIVPTLPALVYGPIDETRGVVAFSAFESSEVGRDDWFVVELEEGAAGSFKSRPRDVAVPVVERRSGRVMARVKVVDVVLDGSEEKERATLDGRVELESLVEATVSVGGGAFDEAGARALIADLLNLDATALPETLPYVLEYRIEATPD